jgi:hypothetical protein
MAARFFRGPLDHLCRALDALAERLREAVARVVGETVARLVGGVVRALLEDDRADADAEGHSDRPADLWHERPGAAWSGAGPDQALAYDDGAADDPGREPARSSRPFPPQRRVKALALGCQATAWWLGRPTGEPRIAVALGVGIVTAAAAYVGGPMVAAGAALAGTAAALAALAGLTRVVAAALARAEQS